MSAESIKACAQGAAIYGGILLIGAIMFFAISFYFWREYSLIPQAAE